jgi:hypothetical protein
MKKSNIVLLISGAIAMVLGAGLYFMDARLSLGALAGYMTGLINFFLIASQVKKMLGREGSTAAKVTMGSFFYLLRLLGAAAVITAVVINAKYFSIAGFLAGFTLCIGVIIAVHSVYASKTGNIKG